MPTTTEQLILEAKALGFTEAAKVQDVLAEAQKRLVQTTKDLESARGSGTIDQVATLTGQQEKLSQSVSLLSGNNERAAKSTINFGEQIRRISPLLGDVVSVFSRYGGGAAIAGAATAAFTAAVRVMRNELAAAQASINATAQAMNEIQGKSRNSQQSIENIRAGTKLGSFETPEQSIAAIERANRIRGANGFLDSGAVDRAVALASGGSFTDDETARIARMMEIPAMRDSLGITEKTSAANIERRLRKGLQRHDAELDKTFSLETQQKYLGKTLAGAQATQHGGATLDLQEIIGRHAPAGADTEYLARLAQSFGDLDSVERYAKNLERAESGDSPFLHIARRFNQGLAGVGVIDDTQIKATPEHLAILRGVFVEMRQHQKKNARQQPASQSPESAPIPATRPNFMPVAPMEPHSSNYNPHTGMPVTINHYNSRFIAPFARGQEQARVNGESRARDLERFG